MNRATVMLECPAGCSEKDYVSVSVRVQGFSPRDCEAYVLECENGCVLTREQKDKLEQEALEMVTS